MQAQKGQWVKLNLNGDEENAMGYDYGGGVLRMWEGELFCDCLEDRRIAVQSVCLKTLRTWFVSLSPPAGGKLGADLPSTAGSCPWYRFGKNMKRSGFGSCFLQGDSSLDDCIFHLTCPCCTLSQEARTLEMNNVQDGIWHGRGDTICVGSYSEPGRTPFELSPPAVVSTKS
uniref:Uncharacterized protein n=1 Tax=Solanum lycopersicum TaxID=4081 RepID=A0A3Q7F4H3_SOLLC